MGDTITKWIKGFVESIPNVVLGLVLALIFYLLARAAQAIVRRTVRRTTLAPGMDRLIGRAAYLIVAGIGLILAITVGFPGIDLSAVFGALGVGSVIVGFALKDIIENFVAGVLIVFNKPFSINDQIATDTDEGTVVDIQYRATILRTYDNRIVLIPNSELFTNRVTVNTRYDTVRHSFDLDLPKGYPLEPLRETIVEVVSGVENVLSDPAPEALVSVLGDYAVTFRVRFWVGPPTTRGEITHTTDKVLTQLYAAFEHMGITNIRPESTTWNADLASVPSLKEPPVQSPPIKTPPLPPKADRSPAKDPKPASDDASS